MRLTSLPLLSLLLLALSSGAALRAELIEDIVAWVNGDIITRSELEREEEGVREDAATRLSGKELETYLKDLRGELLLRMVDRKILVDEARRLYDLDTMGRTFLDSFKEQQGLTSDAEFHKALEQEGMTVEEIKRRLIEMYAPEEVIRFKVTSRIAVSDAEVREFYEKNQARFAREPDVTLREIVLLAKTQAQREEKKEQALAVRERILAGADFAEVAKEVSEAGTKDSGGGLGTLEKSALAPALAKPAFELPVNGISEVIETDYGFHILKVEARNEATVRTFEEVSDSVRELLRKTKSTQEVAAYLKEVRAESQWCVKPEFVNLLPIKASTTCNDL